MRYALLLPPLIALCAAPAVPQDAAPDAAGESGMVEIDTLADRMTVPVSIDGHPSQPFVIDTGAERSVVSRQLAGRLRLAPGPRIRLTTMTGSADVPTAIVSSLVVGPVQDRQAFNAPALEALHLGAQGLLGVAQLRNHMVSIDFDRNEMTLRPSRRGGPSRRFGTSAEEIVIVARRSAYGQLILTEAEFEGRRVTVVVDTGSQISLGNLALQRKLRRIPLKGPITLTSVTGDQLRVNYHVADRVRLGGIALRGLPVAFADVPPFEKFGLVDEPAIMLGMDALRVFRRVEIDFPARRIRFLLPKGLHREMDPIMPGS
ncbi:retropepsin-like aspartic protease [Sphingomonas sp. ST-64]|uniref:Retropepsin-like aspartic protease n=1 Tax=Sphingomonas plantiphila TaxID=3163295 RepID=A0ABW8YJE8_9SPHN